MKECPACRRCFPDHVNHCPNDGDATVHSIAGEPMLDGRYQLERRLGHGGMGVVFQARHIFLKTAHAIKVILPDLVGNDPMLVTRFRQEALAAAAIRHQNIIAVTDFGVARGTMPFLVMEFVKGKSLHDILAAEGSLSPAKALEIISAVGAGVAAAHRQNIVHRDLKPLNIMLQDDMPVSEGLKVLDFGLAKIKSGELLGSFVQAKTSGLMGSPFYMAPEQWSDEEPDVRADIYSLGVILYQMLGGDVPFKGTGIPSIMKKHLTAAPPTLSSMGVNVPPQVEAVVRHALEKEADNRPQTVEAFISELRDAVAQTSANLNRTYVGQSIQSETIITPSHSAISRPPQPAVSRPPQPPQETILYVRTSPAYSRVYLNNVSVGKSDGSGLLVLQEVQRGTNRLRVVHDGYAEWERQIECNGGECQVDAELQSLMQTSMPQMSGDQLAGTITGAPEPFPTSSHSIEAQRLRAQAAALEERARQEETERVERERREQERREMEERDRLAREELAREEEARRLAQEERQRLEAEEARRRVEAEEARRAEEERQRAEEAERLRAEAEAARKQAETEAAERKRLEAERMRAEEEARMRSEEEKRQRAEEEAARRKAEEAAAAKRAEEEKLLRAEAEAARRRAEEESTARKAAEEEAARLRAEHEASKKAQELTARQRAEEERKRAEESERLRAEAEAARKQAEKEAAERKRLEEERKRAEAEAQRRLEEERRRAEAERQRLEKERLEREERDRAALAERERLARELKEREEQMARMAATSIAPDMDATQQQRRGVVTQPMGEQSLADATMAPSWQQSQPGLHQPVAPPLTGTEPKKSSMPMMLIAAVLGVVVLGGGIGAYFLLSPKPAPAEPPQTQNPSKPGDGKNNSEQKSTKAEMIAIPGGSFQMGRNDGPPAEAPAHSVTVSDFSMDKTEVTNAEYAEFVNETKRTPPSHWPGGKVLSGQEQWPVNNVSLDDAKAFAAWRSKRDGVTYRLPTEEEWEYAARNGDQTNLYPWGNSWANDSAIVKMASPQAVGSLPNGKNRWGVVDLIGNVWEWTSSKASLYPGSTRTVAEQDKDSYIMRGGSYASDPSGERAITATFRDWVPASTKHTTLGFRLVRAGS